MNIEFFMAKTTQRREKKAVQYIKREDDTEFTKDYMSL